MEIMIHTHALKHGVSEEDIRFAWEHFIRQRYRDVPNNEQVVAVGVGHNGEFIQMIGVLESDAILIYHALTPPTGKVLRELGLVRR